MAYRDQHSDYPPLPDPDNPLPIYDELYVEHEKWKTVRDFGRDESNSNPAPQPTEQKKEGLAPKN